MNFDLTEPGSYDEVAMLDHAVDEQVVFSTYDTDFGLVPEPQPSAQYRPVWLDDETAPSIVNALNEGWILRTPARVEVNSRDTDADDPVVWRSEYHRDVLSMHTDRQMAGLSIPLKIVKFHSYWTAHLPAGYSALLTEPLGRRNPLFTPFSGCVDFDVFPTITHTPTMFERRVKTEIPEGTPVAQFIPFKRDDMLTTACVRSATDDELDELDEEQTDLATRIGSTTVELDR